MEAPQTGVEASASQARELINFGGMLLQIDPATGEVVQVDSGEPAKEPFVVNSHERLVWFLSRIQEIDSGIAAISSTPEVIRAYAIVRQAEDMTSRLTAQRENLVRWQYNAVLETAAGLLKRGERTYRSIFGNVSVRLKPGRWKVRQHADYNAAMSMDDRLVAWAETHAPEAVKVVPEVRKFLISKLGKLTSQPDADLPDNLFVWEEPTDTLSIETFVRK